MKKNRLNYVSAKERLEKWIKHNEIYIYKNKNMRNYYDTILSALEKQVPKKVEWIVDKTWGVEREQPVCPCCDYYLTPVFFINSKTEKYNKEKITWCDTCGQALDWGK